MRNKASRPENMKNKYYENMSKSTALKNALLLDFIPDFLNDANLENGIWRMLRPGNIIFQVLMLVNSPGLIP